MRASIRQVAEIAKVSPMTVTRVLNGHSLVSVDTRARVLQAVRQVNYIPVRSARQNRHVVTNILGIVPCHDDLMRKTLDSETYAGICDGARRNGYDLLVMLRRESEWMADRQEIRFLDRRSDGFLFMTTGEAEWTVTLEKLVANRIPTVVCYRRDVPEGIAWVDPDNDSIIRSAVRALVAAGHRRLAYLPSPGYDRGVAGQLASQPRTAVNFDDHMRLRAFEAAATELQVQGTVLRNDSEQWSVDARILDEIKACAATGVVCVNDLLALDLWRAAEAAGLRVPRDLSITGVDNSNEAALRGLTSAGFGYDEVGRQAVEAWLDMTRGKTVADACRIVPAHLFERLSIAPPLTANVTRPPAPTSTRPMRRATDRRSPTETVRIEVLTQTSLSGTVEVPKALPPPVTTAAPLSTPAASKPIAKSNESELERIRQHLNEQLTLKQEWEWPTPSASRVDGSVNRWQRRDGGMHPDAAGEGASTAVEE